MILTLLLAICILGCDLLIFFLLQWTLGERRHTRRRRTNAKARVASGLETDFLLVSYRRNPPTRANVVPYPAHRTNARTSPLRLSAKLAPAAEISAHRRKVAAFAPPFSFSLPSSP